MTDAEDAGGLRETDDELDPLDPRLGTEVDRYAIVRLLGKGGMGRVYEARHTRLGRRVAIKFLLPELAARAEILRRFENEAMAAGGLEHPNLVAVIDLGRAADGAPYLVMEYLQGEDGARLLRRAGQLPVTRTANLVLQACRGVEVAHAAGIIHRDLKPENLFIVDAGDGSDHVKVLDFGIAKLRTTAGQVGTRTGSIFGTTPYMSPEQARGAAEIDARTDVWSLGVVMYELLAGRKPFDGDQPLNVVHQILNAAPPALGDVRPGMPAGFVAVVDRALRKDVDERFPTIGAFAAALAPFADRATTFRAPAATTLSATRETTATTDQSRPRRARGRRGLGTALALGAVAVGVATTLLVGSGRETPSPLAGNPTPVAAPPAGPPRVTAIEPASPRPDVSGQSGQPDATRGARARRRPPSVSELPAVLTPPPGPGDPLPKPIGPAQPALTLDPNPY